MKTNEQRIDMEEIEKELFEGKFVRDNQIYMDGKLVELLGIIPNKAEMLKLEKLRKQGLFVYLADTKIVVFVRVYYKKDAIAILASPSLRVLEQEKIGIVQKMFLDKMLIFYPQLIGETPNREQFVDALAEIQYSAGLKNMSVIEREFEESIADFKAQLEEMAQKYPDAFLLPAVDLGAEILEDSDLPIYDKLKICNMTKNVKTAMVICRGYGSVKDQMYELAAASKDFKVKLLMAATYRIISINKNEISGVDLAKYFGCNGAFIRYPHFITEDFIPKIKRINVRSGLYSTLNEVQKKQLAEEKEIKTEQLYDFTRIEDIEKLRSVWNEINLEKAKQIIVQRKLSQLL